MNTRKIAMSGFSAIALLAALASSAQADLITNGNFESWAYPGNSALLNNSDMTGWGTSSGWTFVVPPGKAGAGFAGLDYGYEGIGPNFQLWTATGAGNVGNGGPDVITPSPVGGNFIASDGNYQIGNIYQTVHGLVAGNSYTLSFYAGLAQQYLDSGANTADWKVTLGGGAAQYANFSDPSHGFSGWVQETMTFTATSATELLSFLAQGGPASDPPFLLLDGVSLNPTVVTPPTPVPPPVSSTPLPAALFFVAPALAGVFGFSRRKQNNA